MSKTEKQTITDFKIESLNMSELSSQQKFSLAKIYDGNSELMLQKLIYDDCALDIPTDTGAVTVSILAALLDNKNITGTQRDKLIQTCVYSIDQEVLLRLAKDPQTPFEILNKLSKHQNGDIRAELIWRKPPYISILKTLSQDENWAIRREVAKSSYTTLDVLESFLNETDDEVVLEVIKNQNTTPKILNKFAEKFFNQDGWFNEDEDKYDMVSNLKFLNALVFRVFDANKPTEELESNFILNSIAKHDNEHYRLILAKPFSSYPVPSNIFKILYRTGDEFTPMYLSDSDSSGEELLLKLASDTNTSPLILMNLSNRKYASVRTAVAKNHNTLDMIVKKLTFDKSKEVRKVARDAIFLREKEAKPQETANDFTEM